ncbi:hypothetical protein Tco_0085613 [Tanacetum coccineum]
MKQLQRQDDVYQDEMCPPNKRYALMDANKKIELDNLLCLNESKILANILQNHPFIFSFAASSSVPWIYLGKFWHTLKEDGSKYRLKFVLDRKELTMTLDDFKAIFQPPQATNNNHECFVAALKFSEMVPFYINDLGFTLELRSPSKFKTTNHEDAVLLRKNKAGVGMKIPNWMITDEMKLTEHYRMTTSTPRSPNPNVDEGESSAPRKSTVIRLLEGTENVENAKVNSSTLRKNDKQNDPDTRLEPMINKESPKVEITAKIQPVNTIKEEEESAEDDYELR